MIVGIEDAPSQRCMGYGLPGFPPAPDMGIEFLLHLIEQGTVDDRLVKTGVAHLAVRDLAEIEPVAQQMEEGTPAERKAATGFPAGGDAALRDHALLL